MGLMRLGPARDERPVVALDDETYVDVARSENHRRFDSERVGAPIVRPHQILCIGLNFSDYAAETGQAVAEEPILFTKSPNTLVGPTDDVRMPRGSTELDWEVELGIVLGRGCSYLDTDDDARRAIAGYMLVHDVSERAFQLARSGQWAKGKAAETVNSAGRWLPSADEVPAVGALGMWLDVNGTRRQTGSMATVIFDPAYIVRNLSQFMVPEPGDLINTGTPLGVGMGHATGLAAAGGRDRPGDRAPGIQRQCVVLARWLPNNPGQTPKE